MFFALWPDAGIRRAIVERRKTIDGLSRKRVPDANLHATLLFLGNQPGARVDRLLDAMPALAAASDVAGFTLRLDRFGWFARARVAWLGGPPVPAGRALVSFLVAAADRLGADADRRPWVPHVTLFRDVRRRPALPEPDPLDWPVRRFALVESIPDRPYQVLRTWPLQ